MVELSEDAATLKHPKDALRYVARKVHSVLVKRCGVENATLPDPEVKVPWLSSPGQEGNRKRTRPISPHAAHLQKGMGREALVGQRLPDWKNRRPHDAKL
eukprot:scaffold240658_cov55-Attheya_sp.AAC.2